MIIGKWKLEEVYEINVLIGTRPFSQFIVAICMWDHETTVLSLTCQLQELSYGLQVCYYSIAVQIAWAEGEVPPQST